MKKNIYQNIFIVLIAIFCLSSCVSQKQIAYFQKGLDGADTIALASLYVPKIQSGDILAINVGSLNPMASSFFNPYSAMPVTSDNTAASPATSTTIGSSTPALVQSAAPGFLVDAAGKIEMPLLGPIKLAGLTTQDARDTLKQKLRFFLKEPTVNVRFLNYKISVLGEVAHPSAFVIPNETITLPEALALAGDMTIFGKRENVLVIRDDNGKKEFGRVDLTTREIYKSPYYYLHANDIIYVEPNKGKIAQSDKAYQILPIILSALSFISIILVYTKR